MSMKISTVELTKVAQYVKAVAGAAAAGAAALSAALLDGHIDGGELVTIFVAVLGAFGVVFASPRNVPPSN